MNARAGPAAAPRRGGRRRGEAADGFRAVDPDQAAREREFRTLAENIPDLIVRVDPAGRWVYANRAVEQAFGVAAAQVTGRPPGEIPLPAHVRDAIGEAAGRALASGEEQPFGFRLEEPATRHFAGRVIPERDGEGRVWAALAITYDVTVRTLEAERREELLRREQAARATAESATLARDQFLAIVSHELRSPLNGIKSWTHVLQNNLRDPDPTVRRALAGIMIGVDHQVRLIEDLLDVTRAMSGNLGLAKRSMAPLPVLAEAVESLRATAIEKGLSVATDYAIGGREIHGDPDRIRQVFVNLLTNAIKFTPRGGAIHVRAFADAGMARVDIADTGAGITPDFLPYVFDPFRQADPSSSRRSHEGLGLGLALVQRLAALHGGYVTCQSEGANRGSVFSVHLPLRDESASPVVIASREEPAAAALPSLSGMRVLVIDDQREARESLATLLTQAGARVVTAGSGQEALAHLALADDGETPEAIVCDIAMPGEDGYATLRRIRAWESTRRGTPRCPAIAVSAFSQREDRMRALAEGFQMHLAKPVAPTEIIMVLASVVRGIGAAARFQVQDVGAVPATSRSRRLSHPGQPEEDPMGKRKEANPNIDEERRLQEDERPERESPDPDTLEGPGSRQAARGEEEARNKTTRRGEH